MRRPPRTRRLLVGAASLAAHAGVLALLLLVHPREMREAELQPVSVVLVTPPQPPAPPEPATEAPPEAPPTPKPPELKVRKPQPAPREVAPVEVATGPTSDASELSEAEVAGAATAQSGGGGGQCNMASWLQGKLRKDPQVQAAVAEAHNGRAIRVWDGDWIRREGQEGDGLATVREAIMWEVAFAPQACRAQPVHGLVLLSLNDGPGAPRLAMGAGDWRWSDLLFSHSGGVRQR